jgi:RNA polymerase sigma-70 factor (ECF subfamily)
MEDDDALVQAAIGDRLQFGELYHRYVGRVYKYIFARVGDTHDAQDLTSQTFLAALQDIDRYRGCGQFAAWLFTIARCRIVDHFRASRQTVPLDMAEAVPHPGPSPDNLAEQQLQIQQVARALRTLAPGRAEALTLRVFAELSTGEIARMMGKSETAVRMLVSRAMSDLKARLEYANRS